MPTALEIYNKKMSEIANKIKDFKMQNKSEFEKVEPLRNEYRKAIDNFDIEKADIVAAEIDRIERVAALKEEQIKMLERKDHPEVKKARGEYIESLEAEADGLIAEYTPLHEEIMEAREAYMELAAKALKIENEFQAIHRMKHSFEQPGGYLILPTGFPASVNDHAISADQIRQKGTEIGLVPSVELVKRM